MGKKSSFKNLRKLAADLPEIIVYRRKGTVISGVEALELDLKLPENANPKDFFRVVQSEPGPLNHYRQLKSALERGGTDAVMQYVQAVKAYHARKTKEVEQPETVESAPTFDEGDE